jgi:anti-sigma B factor antagonist
MAGISIETARHGDRCDLVVVGEVDGLSADDLAALGLLNITDAKVSNLVVHLGDVSFIDSMGIGALLRIRDIAMEFDKRLTLKNPSERVQKVLALTGLETVFVIETDDGTTQAPARSLAG